MVTRPTTAASTAATTAGLTATLATASSGPVPSITSWVRLEPRCRDAAMNEGIHARVFDPLWLLARQWQVGEFEGEDAGSPVQARWRGLSAPLTRVWPGAAQPGQPIRPQPYDPAALPLEAVVERRPVRASGPFDAGSSIRLAAESGLHFLRLLEAQPLSRSYRAAFIAQHALEAPTAAERATLDDESRDYWELMAGRVPDGRLLAAAWRAADGTRLPLPAEPAIAVPDRAEVNAAIDAWLATYETLFCEPAPGPDAWQRERLEYAFSAGAGLGAADLTLTAAEYDGGRLDWHSVDLDPAVPLGAVFDQAAGEIARTVTPAPVSFRGAPARRFWEFEDARIDHGLLPAGPGDLPQLLLSDFAGSHGNDWYVIPVDLAVGTLTQTRSLVVADTFGVQTLIRPHEPGTAEQANVFSMFALATLQRPPARDTLSAAIYRPSAPRANLFYLAPGLLRSLDGSPRDEVLLLRDELANLAWAVEKVVQGRVEQRVDRATDERREASAADSPGGALPSYRLATEVPPHWIPLVPQRQGAPDGSLRLVRGRLQQAGGVNAARGAILAGAPLKLHDEEVPREGALVTRGYQCTRWIGGSTVLWLALHKRVGRGEGSSGLRYDGIEP